MPPARCGGDESPELATDAAGNWVAVWYSWENLGGTIGTDAVIVVSRSTDSGATWSSPSPVNTNALVDLGHDFHARLARDAAGNGVRYKDKEGTAAGVTGIRLQTGIAGKTKVKLSAKGSFLALPGAVSANYFQQAPNVVAQLVNSEGTCWTSSFAVEDTSRNDTTSFKAGTR